MPFLESQALRLPLFFSLNIFPTVDNCDDTRSFTTPLSCEPPPQPHPAPRAALLVTAAAVFLESGLQTLWAHKYEQDVCVLDVGA